MVDTQDKQKYLCDNILEKGYDAEDFAEFCEKLMGNIDIESWTFLELQQIVAKYVEAKDDGAHMEHEASFVDYQQKGGDEEELPDREEVREPQPQPEPVYVQPPANAMKRKDSWKREEVMVREENTPPRQGKQEVDVDELWKDPFSKTKSGFGVSSSWGGQNWPTTKPSPPPATKPDFNFTDLLGPSPASTTYSPSRPSVNQNPFMQPFSMEPQKSPSRQPAEVMKPVVQHIKPQPVRPIQSFQPKVQQKYNNFGQNGFQGSVVQPQLPESYVKKPMGNIDIFEMTIDDEPKHFPSPLPSPMSYKPQPKVAPVITNLSGIPLPFPTPTNTSTLHPPASQIRNQSNSMTQLPPTQPDPKQRARSQTRPKAQPPKSQSQFYDIIPCAKSHLRPLLSTPDLLFTITGHQIVNRNFFVPNYVLYHILTKGINLQVKRKYDHFSRLRNLISKFYPGYRIPYLQKNSWINDTSEEFIGSQRTMLEFFMNDLLMNREFRNCRIVEQFLTLDYKRLKAKLNEYDKLVKLRSLEELCLLTGEVSIAYSESHRGYTEKVGAFVGGLGHQLEKFRKLQEQLAGNYASLLKTYAEIGELLAGVEGQCKGFNSTVQFCQFYELQQTINSLTEIYKQLSNSTKFDLKILQSQFKPIFKFQRQNILTIKQLLQTRNKLTQKYTSLHDVTSQPYNNNQKLSQYKLSVDEPSKHPTVLKYQSGYYNAQLVTENMRMFKDLSVKLDRKFSEIGAMYQQKKIEEMGFWARKKGGQLPVVVAVGGGGGQKV